MIYNNKFLELRINSGMNRESLAGKLILSASAIQSVETNPQHNPSTKLILKYIKYFKVGVKDLVNVEDVKLGDVIS